jgi:AGCS family alanine or glycine:cation symporter
MAWRFVFGNRGIIIFRIIFLSATYYGAIINDTGAIIEFCDYMWLMATLPNILTLYIFSNQIKHDLDKYENKLRNKEFTVYNN